MKRPSTHPSLADLAEQELEWLAPSPFLLRFAFEIVKQAGTAQILDVACGGCRNAALLAYLGAQVHGIDKNIDAAKKGLAALTQTCFGRRLNRITLTQCDLKRDVWPIAPASIAGIINIHFLYEPLIDRFLDALRPGGFLLLETVAAHGGNFHELPAMGYLKEMLHGRLHFLEYRERPAGPSGSRKVTVKLVGKKMPLTPMA